MLNKFENKNVDPNKIANQWLSKARVKPTKQRVKIAEYLVGNGKHKHITITQIKKVYLKGL